MFKNKVQGLVKVTKLKFETLNRLNAVRDLSPYLSQYQDQYLEQRLKEIQECATKITEEYKRQTLAQGQVSGGGYVKGMSSIIKHRIGQSNKVMVKREMIKGKEASWSIVSLDSS